MSNEGSNDDDPRYVLRGSELHPLFLGMDSLYLLIEYPSINLFQSWLGVVGDVQDSRLYAGIVHEGFVLRKGGLGYSLSVWEGDVRLFLTDRVSEVLASTGQSKQGMGVMLQCGPKWLQLHAQLKDATQFCQAIYSQLERFGLVNPSIYPIRLNRLDMALDIGGLAVESLSIDEWQRQWVGYAKLRKVHYSPSSGRLQGFSIGSYQGAMSFKVYDKVAQSIKDHDLGFWQSVWGNTELAPVARFEWSCKPYHAKFSECNYLAEYTFDKLVAILNYATLKWGRLCLPDEFNVNNSRWELAPLWVLVRGIIEAWSENYQGIAKREYHLTPDINQSYLSSFAGWLAGLEARIGVNYGYLEAAPLADVITYLAMRGLGLPDIQSKADDKWAIFKILKGR